MSSVFNGGFRPGQLYATNPESSYQQKLPTSELSQHA